MKYLYCVCLCLFTAIINAQPAYFKFDFGTGKPARGYTKVTSATRYRTATGYGFEFGSKVKGCRTSDKLKPGSDYITSQKPFYFSVKLTEGNYLVKILAGDANGGSTITIKAENRRLMVEKAETARGKFKTIQFAVHVRDSVIRTVPPSKVTLKSREHNYLHWDDKLTLEFSNSNPKICALEISPVKNMPVVFLAGNSTVVDQANEPWASWGQMLPAFLNEKVSVANYAESGETLKSFKGAKRLEKIWSVARPGDYLFIEFAHNDQKSGSNHLDPFTTYKQTLKEWIAEARKRKITPVLVTSTSRRRFSAEGKLVNTLGDYPEAVRQTGQEEKVTVIDLNTMSAAFYEALGEEKSKKAFVHFPANTFPAQTQALADDTHFSNYGAYELAKCVVQAIKNSALPLRRYITPEFKEFDPAIPDAFEDFKLPASSFIEALKPDGN